MDDGADIGQNEAAPQSVPQTPQDGHWWDGGQQKQSKQEFAPRRLDTQLDKLTRNSAGKRSQTKTERKRGRYVQARIPKSGKKNNRLGVRCHFSCRRSPSKTA